MAHARPRLGNYSARLAIERLAANDSVNPVWKIRSLAPPTVLS